MIPRLMLSNKCQKDNSKCKVNRPNIHQNKIHLESAVNWDSLFLDRSQVCKDPIGDIFMKKINIKNFLNHIYIYKI